MSAPPVASADMGNGTGPEWAAPDPIDQQLDGTTPPADWIATAVRTLHDCGIGDRADHLARAVVTDLMPSVVAERDRRLKMVQQLMTLDLWCMLGRHGEPAAAQWHELLLRVAALRGQPASSLDVPTEWVEAASAAEWEQLQLPMPWDQAPPAVAQMLRDRNRDVLNHALPLITQDRDEAVRAAEKGRPW